MADEPKRHPVDEEFVRGLVLETGATEAQIRTIISLIGNDRNSIVREALLVSKKPPSRTE